jgi:hypothetical protein
VGRAERRDDHPRGRPYDGRLAADGAPAPLPGEVDRGIGILRLRLDESTTPAAALHAPALGRWGARRYAHVALPE